MKKRHLWTAAFVLFTAPVFAQTALFPRQSLRLGTTEEGKSGVKTNLRFMSMHSAEAEDGKANPVKETKDAEAIITETPDGEMKLYERKSTSYYSYWGSVYQDFTKGMANEIVYGNDGKSVYLKNPFGLLLTDTWLKGEKTSDNIIKFSLPQPIYVETLDNVSTTYYAYRLVLNEDRTSYVPEAEAESSYIEFTVEGDSLLQTDTDGTIILGLATADGEWTGFGDYATRLGEVKDAVTTPPTGLALSDYSLKYTNIYGASTSDVVKVGFVGSDIYVTSLPTQIDGSYIKGTIDGNKAVFKNRQFLGVDDSEQTLSYLLTVNVTSSVDEATGETHLNFYPANFDLVLNYDAATKTFEAETEFVLNAGSDEIYYVEYFKNPELKPLLDVPATPRNPEIPKFVKYDSYLGAGYAEINLYPESTDGHALIKDKLYYNIFLDGKLFTLTKDEYSRINEDLTDIPYNYTENWDIGIDGIEHSIFFYRTDYDKIGVQLIYTGGGETHKSAIVTYGEPSAGITNLANNDSSHCSVTGTYYTDMLGRKVSSPQKGIYIKTETMSDGTIKTSKVVFK